MGKKELTRISHRFTGSKEAPCSLKCIFNLTDSETGIHWCAHLLGKKQVAEALKWVGFRVPRARQPENLDCPLKLTTFEATN